MVTWNCLLRILESQYFIFNLNNVCNLNNAFLAKFLALSWTFRLIIYFIHRIGPIYASNSLAKGIAPHIIAFRPLSMTWLSLVNWRLYGQISVRYLFPSCLSTNARLLRDLEPSSSCPVIQIMKIRPKFTIFGLQKAFGIHSATLWARIGRIWLEKIFV